MNSRIEELFLKLQQGVAVYEYSGNQIKIVRINDAYYNVCGGDMINEASEGSLSLTADMRAVCWMRSGRLWIQSRR